MGDRTREVRKLQLPPDPSPAFVCPHTSARGLYNLLIHLRRPRTIRVGQLGEFAFPAGYYVYTGSAMRGLDARIQRHLRKEKRLRWHIDYLLQAGDVIEVCRHPIDSSCPVATHLSRPTSVERLECALNDALLNLPGAKVIAHRFGSSDCGCETHLVYFASRGLGLKGLDTVRQLGRP